MRIIDADRIDKNVVWLKTANDMFRDEIDRQPTIDPETLPIVKELREKLSRYEQAEREGRLVELPCRVGDEVYVPILERVFPYCIERILLDGEMPVFYGRHGKFLVFEFTPDCIGEHVFLHREEAEAALKEGELR